MAKHLQTQQEAQAVTKFYTDCVNEDLAAAQAAPASVEEIATCVAKFLFPCAAAKVIIAARAAA